MTSAKATKGTSVIPVTVYSAPCAQEKNPVDDLLCLEELKVLIRIRIRCLGFYEVFIK